MSDKKTVIVVVSFGTNIIRAKKAAYDQIVKELQEYSGLPVWQAFTDDDTVRAMDGVSDDEHLFTVEGACETAIAQKFEEIKVIPVFMARGELYYTLHGRLDFFKDRLTIKVADPVLANLDACKDVAELFLQSVEIDPAKEYLLVSHSNPKFPFPGYKLFEQILEEKGFANIKLIPLMERDSFGQAITHLKKRRALERGASVIVLPLIVAWGDYMANTIYNNDDSFVANLRSAGYRAVFTGEGMGEYPAFRTIYKKRLDALN